MIIQTILKRQDAVKVSQAQKLDVRELEIYEEKGNYIAFVDQGSDSYDVNIKLDGEDVKKHTCDCKLKDSFCVHQLAVLLALSTQSLNRSSKLKKIPAKNKVKESEQLLMNIDPLAIKSWLLELFKSNKDIELAFVLKFSTHKIFYQPEDITKILNDVVVSVVGKRKRIELSEVKKIIDLWEISLVPVWEFIEHHILQEEAFNVWNSIIDNLDAFEYKLFYNGSRINKLLFSCYEKLALILTSIPSEVEWERTFYWIWNEFWRVESEFKNLFIPIKLMYGQLDLERKELFVNRVEKHIKEFTQVHVRHDVDVDSFLLDLMIDAQLFDVHYAYFKPKHWQNNYNIKLIHAIKDIKPELAISYCLESISGNSVDTYNLPYLEILEELYTKSDDRAGLVRIKMQKFYDDPNPEDIVFIFDNLEDKDLLTRFRKNTLSCYRNSLQDPFYVDIYFTILEYDKNYKKMIEVVDHKIAPYALLKYWDFMYSYDKGLLINSLANNFISPFYPTHHDLRLIMDKIIHAYDVETLKKVFEKTKRPAYDGTLQHHVLRWLAQQG